MNINDLYLGYALILNQNGSGSGDDDGDGAGSSFFGDISC